ncbi:trypsin-like serine peptidase, partial [Streptomyces anulatus]
MPSTALAATAVAAVLALTATACGPEEDNAGGSPSASADQSSDGKVAIPDDLKDRLKEHGIDPDKWRDGEWKNWDKDKWLREAKDFVNPIIDGLWDPDRMREADKPPENPVDNDISGDDGVTDPTPAPVQAAGVATPYHDNAPESGKLLFDGPQGSMVCSATVVKDPANPGKSNMVWTAGHCVHAGKKGGWYRNIAFVPAYNNDGLSLAELETAPKEKIAPYGVWWGKWAQTSEQWIAQGAAVGGQGAPYDFAVLHVTPEKGAGGKSLEETVGSALPVEFNAPAVPEIAGMTATGYPAAPPYDGQKLLQCKDKPGRLSVFQDQPTMYRVGCTMT